MSSTLTTTTHATLSLPLTGHSAPPPPTPAQQWASSLRTTPLTSSGALDSLPQRRLTPAIGKAFEAGFQLREVLAMPKGERDPVIRELALQSEWAVFWRGGAGGGSGPGRASLGPRSQAGATCCSRHPAPLLHDAMPEASR